MKPATPMTFLAALALTAFAGCATTNEDVGSDNYQSPKDQSAQGNSAGEMQLPPGISQADMQACMAAATPGKQHEMLARGVGHWTGKHTMWMTPDAQPATSNMSSTVSTIMDGRFTKVEIEGDMMGMPFHGLGYNGYDNVAQKYVSTWIDNWGTGFMIGDGTMSADGNTLTWNYRYNCPITKGPTTMRQVEHRTGDNSMTLDMYGPEPHSGKEFKMMHIEMTRQSP